ncbi:MAG: hypothetical protein HEQ13_06055 [Dolichospermum sp. DEX189]|nr:hypothetical protein [Dolichospermum sp. DEX189]
MARQEARGTHARVKRVWAILLFFTQIGFIVFTYLSSMFVIRQSVIYRYIIIKILSV